MGMGRAAPMTCWRCGRRGDHADWCVMPGGCDHCGWSPCRWWCEEARWRPLNQGMPSSVTDSAAYLRERDRRIAAGEWVFA